MQGTEAAGLITKVVFSTEHILGVTRVTLGVQLIEFDGPVSSLCSPKPSDGEYKASLSTAQCALYEPVAPFKPLICEHQVRRVDIRMKSSTMLHWKTFAHGQRFHTTPTT